MGTRSAASVGGSSVAISGRPSHSIRIVCRDSVDGTLKSSRGTSQILTTLTGIFTFHRHDDPAGMDLKLMGVELTLSLIRNVLAADLSVSGPAFPTTPLGVVGWVLLFAGLAGMRLSLSSGQ